MNKGKALQRASAVNAVCEENFILSAVVTQPEQRLFFRSSDRRFRGKSLHRRLRIYQDRQVRLDQICVLAQACRNADRHPERKHRFCRADGKIPFSARPRKKIRQILRRQRTHEEHARKGEIQMCIRDSTCSNYPYTRK